MIGLETMETIWNSKFQSTIITTIFLNIEQVSQPIDLKFFIAPVMQQGFKHAIFCGLDTSPKSCLKCHKFPISKNNTNS